MYAIFLNSNFASLIFAKKYFGNTIISLCSMRCAIFLNSNFASLALIKKNMHGLKWTRTTDLTLIRRAL